MLARHQIKFMLAHRDQPQPVPSKRFETTTFSGTEFVANRRHEVSDREEIKAALHERKVNNTKTSISFGLDPPVYRTEKDDYRESSMNHDITADIKRNRLLKQELTCTHLDLGQEKLTYERVNSMIDPTGNISQYRGVLNTNLKAMLSQSNLHFGDALPSYTTSAQESMSISNIDPEDQMKNKTRNLKMKAALMKTHLYFGNDVPEYISDTKRGFQYNIEEVRKIGRASLAKEVKDDLRRSHFEFGDHPTIWETDFMRNQRESKEAGPGDLEVSKQHERNKALKLNLQKTSYSIGEDIDYM